MTTNAVHHYATLARSPLLMAPIIESFFQEIKPSKRNILLGYLVLPLVLYPPSREFLNRAKATSSIRTLSSDRRRIAGLPQRVAELRSTSSLAMKNSIACGRLILSSDLSLKYCEHESDHKQGMQTEIRAASRLAVIFKDYEVTTIYRLLGVTKL